MEITQTGKFIKVDKNIVTIAFDYDIEKYLEKNPCEMVQMSFADARMLSDEQRKIIFALVCDISDHFCGDKEYTRQVLTSDFCFINSLELFSLSTIDMSTASRFIRYLIEFCIYHAVPCKIPLAKRCEDIEHMLYCSLLYKRCAVCGKDSEFHHCTGSRAGMGRLSVEIPLAGLKGMALCREHHNEIHSNAENVFYEKYHVMPITIDDKIAKKYPHYIS